MGWAEDMRGFVPRRALIGAVLLGAMATATAQEAAPVVPSPLPEWLVVAEPLPPTGIPEAWKAVSRDVIPYPRESTSTPQGTTPRPYIELQAAEGDYAGHWRFLASRGRHAPHGAWRLVVSETAPYRVHAQLYCDEESGGCQQLRLGLASLQAPRPLGEAPMADWLQIVTAGPCENGPVRMTAPRFPPQALREATGGRVRVRVAFNACGQVRHASIFESSGHRHLDRAAVEAARSWRVPLPEGHTGPGQGVVPLLFEIQDDTPPAD